jgi:hypothetical protein
MTARERSAYIRADSSCGNIECPNKAGSGPFDLITVGRGNVVGGHRSLRLFLCMPCANALDEILNGTKS